MMRLLTALRANLIDVVAFTGGGGKTSAMFRLAAEIVAAGGRVVTTTTTRLFASQIGLASRHVMVEGGPGENGEALAAITSGLEEARHVLVTAAVEAGRDKAFGVAPEWIAALHALPGSPAVVIEADGARMRPFKAPAEHEPVIPPEADLVVPVVGADVFGVELDAERVHRHERVAALAGVELGTDVSPDIVSAVLAHSEGGLKGVPGPARVMVLINKVESVGDLAAARETARLLLAHERILGVTLGVVRREPPARETWGRVAGVVLAAGQSTRMGRSKQVLPWGETTMVGAVVRGLQSSGVTQVVVVTGDGREAVEAAVRAAAVAGGGPVTFAHNADFAESEMARSLQAALAGLPPNCLAALVALADQPRLSPSVVERVIARWRETQAPVVAPYYHGRRGHPLLFDRTAWPSLMALPPSANPRQALENLPPPEQVEVDDEGVLVDVDTPEAYARAVAGG